MEGTPIDHCFEAEGMSDGGLLQLTLNRFCRRLSRCLHGHETLLEEPHEDPPERVSIGIPETALSSLKHSISYFRQALSPLSLDSAEVEYLALLFGGKTMEVESFQRPIEIDSKVDIVQEYVLDEPHRVCGGDCHAAAKRMEADCEVCAICLDEVSDPEKIKIACNHRFHESCIFNWFRKSLSCPLCRRLPLEIQW